MLQLNPPLIRFVVAGPGWEGPTGKGLANFIEPGHPDDDIVWIIDMDDGGQTWCVPNRYVRAPRNITHGRTIRPADDNRASSRAEHQQHLPLRHGAGRKNGTRS